MLGSGAGFVSGGEEEGEPAPAAAPTEGDEDIVPVHWPETAALGCILPAAYMTEGNNLGAYMPRLISPSRLARANSPTVTAAGRRRSQT